MNELVKSGLALDSKINVNIDGSLTTNDFLKAFDSCSDKKILHKLVKHLIPGIHLKLFKLNCQIVQDDSINQLNTENIESPWCCPSLNYWNIFNQYIICSLLNDGKNKISSRSKDTIDLGKKDSWDNINWEIFSTKLQGTINDNSN